MLKTYVQVSGREEEGSGGTEREDAATQPAPRPLSYATAIREILEKDGVGGLFGRGLQVLTCCCSRPYNTCAVPYLARILAPPSIHHQVLLLTDPLNSECNSRDGVLRAVEILLHRVGCLRLSRYCNTALSLTLTLFLALQHPIQLLSRRVRHGIICGPMQTARHRICAIT